MEYQSIKTESKALDAILNGYVLPCGSGMFLHNGTGAFLGPMPDHARVELKRLLALPELVGISRDILEDLERYAAQADALLARIQS